MTYSSSLALGRQRFAGKNQNTTSFRTGERSIGPVSNTIILVVLACLLGLLYLTQVTKTNAAGYTIDGLQKHHTELQIERPVKLSLNARNNQVSFSIPRLRIWYGILLVIFAIFLIRLFYLQVIR